MNEKTSVAYLRKAWEMYVESNRQRYERSEDEVWGCFKSDHAFDPLGFQHRPPWCIAGASNNKWAAKAFLGDARREAAWAVAGYLDRPFDFAYLWLDYAGFNGLLRSPNLPYTVRTPQSEMRRKARLLERLLRKASAELATWPFRDRLNLENLIKNSDYNNSITIPVTAQNFTRDEHRIGIQLMRAGARQQLRVPLGGRGSVLERAADALSAWQPPPSLVSRPNRPGLRQRFAARWLDATLSKLGDSEMPPSARFRLISELTTALGELGEWPDDPWTDEQVRRCLDGKSRQPKHDSV